MGLATTLYLEPTPELLEALDRHWGGKEPRHDRRFAVVREWYVPGTQWRQHRVKHPTSYHGYHGLDISHWRYLRGQTEYIALWCECHGDEEHARLTIEDMKALLEEVLGPSPLRIIREELRDQEKR